MRNRVLIGSFAALLATGCVASAPATATRIDPEPAGANCPDGGSAVRLGADDNGNGALEDAEIDSVQYICSGATAAALVRLADEPAGAHCAHGGRAVLSGLDRDHDGTLADGEVTSTMYVCRDAEAVPLTRFEPEPAGSHCTAGGTAVRSGLDTDGNGDLDDAEVATVQYICRDIELTRLDVEAAGAHCTGGGASVKTGLDRNGDGTLEDDEVMHTEYVCGSVIAGNYDAITQADVDALKGIEAITGNLKIHFTDAVTAVDLPDLRAVGGDLDLGALANATRVQAPVLHSVGGVFAMAAVPKVTTISLPALVSAGTVRITGDTGLTSVKLPALARVTDAFRIDGSPVAQLDLSSLTDTGSFDLWNLKVAAIDLPALRTTADFDVADSSASSLSAASLQYVSGALRIGRDPSLASLDLSRVQVVQGNLTLRDLPALVGLALPLLDTAGGHVQVFDNAKLISVSMPKLVTIPGWLWLTGDPALANLQDLGAVRTIGQGFYFQGNQGMHDLSQLKALTTIGGETTIGATQLERLAMPSLTTVDLLSVGRFDHVPVLDNPLLVTVDLPRLRDATTVFVSSAPHVTKIELPALEAVWALVTFWDAPAMKKCTITPWLAGLKVAPTQVKLVNIDETSTCP
jgi:hypothetical protein